MTKPTEEKVSSARWRIVGWVMLTTAITVIALIFLVRQFLLHDVSAEANEQTVQEVEEFRTFAQNGVNPETAQPFTSASDMLQTYISRQYSGRSEQLIGMANGQIIYLKDQDDFATEEGYRLHTDRALLNKINTDEHNSGIEETPAGRIHWGRVDVQVDQESSANSTLIVVEYTAPGLANVQHTVNYMMGISAAALLGAFAISWLVAGQITKPVRDLRRVAEEITEKDITGRVPVTGHDDVAAMSATFNQMLDRLEESSKIQRQFLDDVSHELRTPITIVRGHLELMERFTPDQEATLALVDDELDRMGRIVADLLLLAKSERPDFVQPAETDVAELMINLESKVQAFSEHRWVMSTVADGTVSLDGQRITQAMIQLAANAAQYSPPGSHISIGSEYVENQGQRALQFWVRDRGPGVAPEDAEGLFDRFRRDNSKNPATAQKHSVGVGLGLAIVRTIAETHRGSAWVRQPETGPGAVFGLTIPAEEPTPENTDHLPTHTEELA